ncbi:MAG TPA: PEP-utilizing enzyme [Steroidobacteraceae bacterium]|nr:PEP-utilizing enzyme [Steroidobacteraceae bacterium]
MGTKPKIWPCDDEGSERFPVFTRANAGEAYVEVASPLGWSTFGRHSFEPAYRGALYEMGAFTPEEFKPVGQCEAMGCFGGYIYLNASVARVIGARIPGLSVEAIDASFFGDYPDVPPYRPDPRDENPQRTAALGVWLKSLFGADPLGDTQRDALRVDALAGTRPDFQKMSNASLLEYFHTLIGDVRHLDKRHVLNIYGCNALIGLIAQTSQAAGAAHLAAKATAAVGGVESAAQPLHLWELSREVASSPVCSAAFDQGVDGLLDRLRASGDRGAERFLRRWDEFIERWGFMGPSIWDLRSATYRTDPEIALRMLDRARRAPDASSPAARSATLVAERETAIAEIERRLADDPQRRGQFAEAARCARDHLAARELSKVYMTRLMEEARAPLRELGHRLVRQGLLTRWDHVLLVTDDEATAFIADPGAYLGLIDERAARLQVLMSKEPPFVFEGDPPPLSAYRDRGQGRVERARAGTELKGIGASPGRYTGRARVITSLSADSELEPGEVIVAVTTDAPWAALFLAAGAVVVETGSVISHAAIISRELGIPAAVSVAAATRRIRDGALITVDGNTGSVIVHDHAAGRV